MIVASSASVAPARSGSRRSVSRIENRQVRSLPSAVRRRRLQSAQNGSETGLMNPISPPPSANRKTRAVACGSRGSASSACRVSISARSSSPVRTASVLPGAVAVERHELDEPDLVVARARELAEAQDLVLGEVAHRDRVHLDRAHALVRGDRREAAQHLRQRVAAGDLVEAVAGQRVDRDVDAVDAGGDEGVGVALEQVAVGGDGEVLDAPRSRAASRPASGTRAGPAARRRSGGRRGFRGATSTRTSRSISSNESTSERSSHSIPSAGMQYRQRKLQRSVTDTRRSVRARPWASIRGSGAWLTPGMMTRRADSASCGSSRSAIRPTLAPASSPTRSAREGTSSTTGCCPRTGPPPPTRRATTR